jgi:hypothetical protein
VKILEDAVIPEEKLTRYLLVPRIKDDKSKFLAQAGFTQDIAVPIQMKYTITGRDARSTRVLLT